MTAFTVERPQNAVEGIHIVENFISNDLVSDNNIGQQGWELITIANASTLAYLTGAATQVPGGLRFTTAGTADGDGGGLQSNDDGITFPTSKKGGGVAFLARYPNIGGNALAGNNFRIGVHSSLTATEPTDGIWVDSDAGVLSVDAASADHGDNNAAVTGVSTLTSGTTMVLGTWHLFELYWSGENGQGGPNFVELFVDGEAGASINCTIDDDETAELKILHWQDSGGADDLELDIGWYEYFQWYDLPTASAV